jgi:hypothetical protein
MTAHDFKKKRVEITPTKLFLQWKLPWPAGSILRERVRRSALQHSFQQFCKRDVARGLHSQWKHLVVADLSEGKEFSCDQVYLILRRFIPSDTSAPSC